MLTPRQESLLLKIRSDFLEHGFSGFTIDGATRTYRCSKATLYALGATRDDVVKRAIVSYFREITQHTDEALTSGTGPTDAIRRYFDAIAQSTAIASATFWRDMAAEEVSREIYSTNTQAAAVKLARTIEVGVREGEFRGLDPQFTASMVSTALEAIQQQRTPASTPTPEAYRELGKILLTGISLPPIQP